MGKSDNEPPTCRDGSAGSPFGLGYPMNQALVLDFSQIGAEDTARVGGKNASLGELFHRLTGEGVRAVDGFATTSDAYWRFICPELADKLRAILATSAASDRAESEAGAAARRLVSECPLPPELVEAIENGYDRLIARLGRPSPLAVRSSATAEDLPGASFAGQHESFLNVEGKEALVAAVRRCYASIFTDRAIDYRVRNGFDHMQVALSVGVQPMIRSDEASSGVIFTLDPDSGFRDAVVVSGSYGLGESVVQGLVGPDEWTLFKPTLRAGKDPIIGRRLGTKETTLVFGEGSDSVRRLDVTQAARSRFCLTDAEVQTLARWACIIERHYSVAGQELQPMDIEWAKDGPYGELFILQARPETVHSAHRSLVATTYRLTATPPEPLITGQAVGERIGTGVVRVVSSVAELDQVQPGDVLVAPSTDPDWEPVMKRVAAIVTDLGGRTSHAAIVAREVGVPCIVGTGIGTTELHSGDRVTVSCAEGSQGRVYAGDVPFVVDKIDLSEIPETRTKIYVNVADPAKAFSFAQLPVSGVGLARMEFIVANLIGMHPMALCRYPNLSDLAAIAQISDRLNGEDPQAHFVRRLSEGIAQIAAAFYPRPVIVRTSDFKTNEYARLIGGREFEPDEENPMLGFRGASRYYDPRYADGFRLECLALRRVRREMGLTNVKVMIPFCRTLTEATRVVAAMAGHGLLQGEDGLEIYGMCELPSNALDADGFLEIFDGYSIGSNDLTQLTLGIDRDSGTVSHLFDEQDFAVKSLITMAIAAANRAEKPIGICGQAPSDYPEFAAWLVRHGIGSISLNPDSVLKALDVVARAEAPVKPIPLSARVTIQA